MYCRASLLASGHTLLAQQQLENDSRKFVTLTSNPCVGDMVPFCQTFVTTLRAGIQANTSVLAPAAASS